MTNPWLDHPQLQQAARAILAGGVVAYPTEGVWGLGCLPGNEAAVGRILALKGRSVDKGLILVAGDEAQFAPLLTDLDSHQRATLSASWPGPNTWLIPHSDRVPCWISGQHPKVALRVSDHPVVQALCTLCNSPLVSTSANPQGLPSALTAKEVSDYFSDGIDALSPGETGGRGRPSVIRDLLSGQAVRA